VESVGVPRHAWPVEEVRLQLEEHEDGNDGRAVGRVAPPRQRQGGGGGNRSVDVHADEWFWPRAAPWFYRVAFGKSALSTRCSHQWRKEEARCRS
jgi:hypothetical protein